MKEFKAPVVEIEKFEMMDVITTSTTGENELPGDREE